MSSCNYDFKNLVGSKVNGICEFMGNPCIEFNNSNRRGFLIIEAAFRIIFEEEIIFTCQDFCYKSIERIKGRCIEMLNDCKVVSIEVSCYKDISIKFDNDSEIQIFNNINLELYDSFIWSYYELDDMPIYSITAN